MTRKRSGAAGRLTSGMIGLSVGLIMVGIAGAEASGKHKVSGVGPTGAMTPSLPAAAKPAAAPFGSYCLTPLGRVGPGLAAPLGSPCTGPSAQGPIAGQTVD